MAWRLVKHRDKFTFCWFLIFYESQR